MNNLSSFILYASPSISVTAELVLDLCFKLNISEAPTGNFYSLEMFFKSSRDLMELTVMFHQLSLRCFSENPLVIVCILYILYTLY